MGNQRASQPSDVYWHGTGKQQRTKIKLNLCSLKLFLTTRMKHSFLAAAVFAVEAVIQLENTSPKSILLNTRSYQDKWRSSIHVLGFTS